VRQATLEECQALGFNSVEQAEEHVKWLKPVGSVWDTGTGNQWEVLEHLSGDRVRVWLRHCSVTKKSYPCTSDYTFVWNVASLVGTRIK
jgi:hypothetical protein